MVVVKVYSTPRCPWCDRAKAFLAEKGVEYQDIDVQHDRTAAEEMIAKSGQRGVPVLEIEREVIIGFDPEAITAALKKAEAKAA